MNDALEKLTAWHHKHRTFKIVNGGSEQPGDGTWVELRDKKFPKTITVDELDLIDHEKDYFPTVGDLILEALRQWEASESPKG